MPNVFSPERGAWVDGQLQRALDDASPTPDLGQIHFHGSEEERFISREVARMLYEPQLPHGGHKERRIVEKLLKMAKDQQWAHAPRAYFAAKRWEAIAGRYYECKPITERTNKKDFEIFTMSREAADRAQDWDRKWFAQLMLDGAPEAVSDFWLECMFLMEKPDGHIDRLVRLHNVRGEKTKLIPIDAEAFHAPQKFRKWSIDHGNYSYGGGEKQLQKIHEDVASAAAFRTVTQVVTIGWHALEMGDGGHPGRQPLREGIWFFGDCAYADGKRLSRDEFGIYWHKGRGYLLSDRGRESSFAHGRPKLCPEVKIQDLKLDLSLWKARNK